MIENSAAQFTPGPEQNQGELFRSSKSHRYPVMVQLSLYSRFIPGAFALVSLAADVPDHIGAGQLHRQDPAVTEPSTSEPAGRGRLALPAEITLPRLDPEVLDRMRTEHGPGWLGPTRSLPAEIGGTWAWTQEGKRVWRVTIRATAAHALRVRFEDFDAEGPVWLYGDEWSGPHLGPYSGLGPHGSGRFWSEFVFGEDVTIEYAPGDAVGASDHVPFRIRSIAHIAAKRFPVPGKPNKPVGDFQPRALAGCHLDVSCYPDLQERDQPSVAALYITDADRTGTCTGFLINPKYDSSSRLLLLTAGHCVDTQELASDVVFAWNYQTEECYGNPNWEQWAGPLALTYGATFVVAKDDRYDDFALLMLSKAAVTEATGWWAKGWTTTAVRTGDQVSTVGHPDGNHKRVAFGEIVAQQWSGASSLGFQTIQWRLGTTESGASGSPVLKSVPFEGQRFWAVVGILSADNAPSLDKGSLWGPHCDADYRVAFSRFDHIYKSIRPYMEDEDELPDLPPSSPSTPPPFQPEPVEVALGASGQSITLMTTEAGGYTLNGSPITSGVIYTAANGSYRLTFSGTTWTATFVPETMDVALGNSGESVTIVQSETGGYLLNGELITSETTHQASNGATYGIAFGPDGPVAVYIPSMITVILGELGGEIVLTPAEDQQSYLLDSEVFHSGTVIESNGRSYRVTRDASGNWTAAYEGRRVSLRLGDSGSGVILREGEDGSWWIGWTKIENGHIRSAHNGDKYRLTLVNGEWVATRVDP